MPHEITISMHPLSLYPFLESLPANLAYHVFKVISDIYLEKSNNGGRATSAWDSAWPPLSRYTVYRKLLSEHRRRRANRWRHYRSRKRRGLDYQAKIQREEWKDLPWEVVGGAKEDIQAKERQNTYGAPPPRRLPGPPPGPKPDISVPAGLIENIKRRIKARRRIPRLKGVPFRAYRRSSLPPALRRLWRKVFKATLARLGRLPDGADFGPKEKRARAAQSAWRAVIVRAYLYSRTTSPGKEQLGKAFMDRYALAINRVMLVRGNEGGLRDESFLESGLVTMMIDSGAIYNSLLPGTVQRTTGSDGRTRTEYSVRRKARGGSNKDKERRPGHICEITVTSLSPDELRAEVIVGVNVVDEVTVGSGDFQTTERVPYAYYHHYAPSRQEPWRDGRRLRPQRRLWPVDLAALLEAALTSLLRSRGLLPMDAASTEEEQSSE